MKALFLAALDVPVPERAAFLEVACGGDAGLRAELLSLLASEAAAGTFCETPAARLLAEADDDVPGPGPAGPRLEPGAVLGNYEISGFLSAGGMGEVYRARHLVLGRDVAIKTVRGVADDAARRRLLREARHAAGLEHPGICPIHEVGTTDGVPWIVMPLLSGRSLDDVIRTGALELPEVLAVGVQVAAALEHAHTRGIVHRDLKSSNIILDAQRRAIVLDFGVSRRLPRPDGVASADITLTVTGVFAGTLSHMAPEVLFGGEPDPRSDIWSLGVLLYELAAGTLPFQGRTHFETSAAILNEAPRPLPGRVPLALRLVIERCLAKDPRVRYQTATAARLALEAIRRRRAWPLVGRHLVAMRRRMLVRTGVGALVLLGAVAVGPRLAREAGVPGIPAVATLAVLPLEHDNAEDAAVYAAGTTEALTVQLAEAAEVRLMTVHAAHRAAAEGLPPAEAARRLRADVVVTGRVRRDADRVLVDARLIAASSGRVLWSDSFERSTAQVLALHTDLVLGIANAVRLVLRPGADERLTTVRAVNPEAYEEYLKGRFEWNRRSPASLQQAVAHFERAIELDPTWAPAYAALADCYNQFGTVMVGTGSPREFRPRAEAAAIRALQIDPRSADAHATLAYARHYDWRFAEAEDGFRRAIELNPSHVLARIWYANLLMSRGRYEEALYQVRRAQELDPFSPVVNTNVGWVLIAAGRAAEAISELERVLVLDSSYAQARMRLVDALTEVGRVEEAHEQAHRLITLNGNWPPALIVLGIQHVRTAPDSARALLGELLQRRTREHVSTAGLAALHNALGDVEDALAWYARVLDERSNASVYLRPAADSTRGALADPRFRALLEAAGLN